MPRDLENGKISDVSEALTMSDKEFVRLALLLNLPLVIHPVRFLVVDEQRGGALARHPLLEQLSVLLERLL